MVDWDDFKTTLDNDFVDTRCTHRGCKGHFTEVFDEVGSMLHEACDVCGLVDPKSVKE